MWYKEHLIYLWLSHRFRILCFALFWFCILDINWCQRLWFFPRTPVDILYISRINSIASRQFGAVSRQYGAVSRQYGAVSRQYGAVRGQYGAVRGLFSEFSIFFCFYFFSAPYFTAHCSILPAGYLWYQYFHQHKFFLGFIFFQMID